MIERVTAFKSSDGRLFVKIEEMQRHELEQLLLATTGAKSSGTDRNPTFEIPIDQAVLTLVQKKDQVIDILTTTARSKARARAVNGGTKNRTGRGRTGTAGAARPALPAALVRADGATERDT